jgi:primosomal replication protein N
VKRNQFLLDAEILETGALRRTPAGIEAVTLKLGHHSEQPEGEGTRTVDLTLDASAFGELAPQLGGLPKGGRIAVKGFLTRRSPSSDFPVLIINEFRSIETR